MDFIKMLNDEKEKEVILEEIVKIYEQTTVIFAEFQNNVIRSNWNSNEKSLIEIEENVKNAEKEYQNIVNVKSNFDDGTLIQFITLEVMRILYNNVNYCYKVLTGIIKESTS